MEYYQTVGTKYYYKSDSHTGTGTSITYDYETKTWNDEGSQVPYHLNTTSTFASTTSLVNPAEIHGFGSQQNHNGTRYFSVSNPYYEAPSVPDIQPIVNTGGSWNGVHSWASPTTETINGSVEYHYSLTFGTSRIAYRTIDKTWYDSDTSSQPSALSSDAFSTQSSELVNPQYVWIGDTSATNTDFYISFDNPYYEA